jgi:ADP-heptose:LPS heptosyltransferase
VTAAAVIAGAERLGDLLFLTGPLRLLAEARPGLRIVVWTVPKIAEILEENPHVGAILTLGPPRRNALLRRVYARWAARALRAVLERAGAAPGETTLVAIRDRPAYREAAQSAGLSYLARDILGESFAGHQTRRIALALEPLGLRPPDGPVPPELRIRPGDLDDGVRALVACGAEAAHPLVLLQTGSRDTRIFGGRPACRDWPAERFAALAAELARKTGARAAIHARGLAERLRARRVVREFAARAPDLDPPAVLPRLGPRALAGIMRRAALVVSNDTGPLHLATAVGAPVLGLFGPSDPDLTGPVPRDAPAFVLAPKRPHGRCDVPLDRAIEAALRLLQSSERPG